MRDIDFPPDEDYLNINPEDPEEQKLYFQRFRGLYNEEVAHNNQEELLEKVITSLQLCPSLMIRDPRDVLRFLRLKILVFPKLKPSPLLVMVVNRVMTAINDWSATKRLDFIDRHVIDRPLPKQEPDFGAWWDGDTSLLGPE